MFIWSKIVIKTFVLQWGNQTKQRKGQNTKSVISCEHYEQNILEKKVGKKNKSSNIYCFIRFHRRTNGNRCHLRLFELVRRVAKVNHHGDVAWVTHVNLFCIVTVQIQRDEISKFTYSCGHFYIVSSHGGDEKEAVYTGWTCLSAGDCGNCSCECSPPEDYIEMERALSKERTNKS